jgi:RHS repeat-associated protein
LDGISGTSDTQTCNYQTSDPSFSGQNADTATSLYDFTFREHSPSQGRWISPDPAGVAAVDPTNPQSRNRYAYVLNNPLALVDPLGLEDASCADRYVCAEPSTGSGGGSGMCPDCFQISTDVWVDGGISWIFDNGISWGSGPVNVGGGTDGGGASGTNDAPCRLVAPGGYFTPGPRAIALFQPQMANALTNAFTFLNSQGITPQINSGFRTPADQTRMQTGASGPNPAAIISWHQVGMAVDINGTTSSFFPTIVSAMQAQGLRWGGTFTHRDPTHFQLPPAGTSPTAAMVSACGGGHG